ncbi:sterol desaturase family protein [Mucilaginibacter hurinus]|uniref:Sterol desaturase family protein n=1 Tax=Mucilaginibacter hurinus TaxID=2201324 RepID=A0A367GRZ8_9SPHI|nr:sterol desaturase family protein [Mucilaginibacter hurinus]RCH55596.1 sterol desaturase family protein [Mucilaginibacter hurinus]
MEVLFESLGKIFTVTLARYFVIAGIPFVLFYWLMPQRFIKSKIQARYAKNKDFIREIMHSVQTSLVLAGIGVGVIVLSLNGYTLIYTELTAADWWYIPVSLFLSLTIHDTYFYWMHRTLHHPNLFKYTHLLHHKSITPSPFASYSFHFLEAVAEGLILVLLVFVLPMHKITILLFIIVGFIINVYGHLGYEIAPRRFRNSIFFEVFSSSVYHNLHHSKFRGNYGLYYRVWDRLMKTEHPEYVAMYDRIQEKRFGEAVDKEKETKPAESLVIADTAVN